MIEILLQYYNLVCFQESSMLRKKRQYYTNLLKAAIANASLCDVADGMLKKPNVHIVA